MNKNDEFWCEEISHKCRFLTMSHGGSTALVELLEDKAGTDKRGSTRMLNSAWLPKNPTPKKSKTTTHPDTSAKKTGRWPFGKGKKAPEAAESDDIVVESDPQE